MFVFGSPSGILDCVFPKVCNVVDLRVSEKKMLLTSLVALDLCVQGFSFKIVLRIKLK